MSESGRTWMFSVCWEWLQSGRIQKKKNHGVKTEASPSEALRDSLMVFKLTIVALSHWNDSVIKSMQLTLRPPRYSHIITNKNNTAPITHSISARSKIGAGIVLGKQSDWLHSQGHNHWMSWCNYTLISLPNEHIGGIHFSSEKEITRCLSYFIRCTWEDLRNISYA